MRPAIGPWLLLTGLFGALALVVGMWVAFDQRPPIWDHANHLERAAKCGQILSARGLAGVREILEMSTFYPPVVTCSAGLLYFIFPIAALTSQSVMLAFLALALLSLFLLGRLLFDAPTGLLAALIFGAAPFVVYSATNFQLDLPLAAAVILSLLVLVQTEAFARRSWSIAMGVTLAFGMLIKPPFAAYLLPPLVLVAWQALRATGRWERLFNLAVALVLGGALSLPWYGIRVFGFPIQVMNRAFKQAAESGYPEVLTLFSLTFYPRTLVYIFGLLAAPLFAWGLVALAREYRARGLLWSATLVPFAVVLLIQNKNFRYVLPILPVAALIAAVGLKGFAPPWRRALSVAIVCVSVGQVSATAFGIPSLPRTVFTLPLVFSFPPSPVQWPHRQALDVIVREARRNPATVSVVPNYAYFSVSNFRYYAVRDRLPLKLTRAWDEYPLNVDFIVLKTGNQGPEFSIRKPKRIMERFARGDPAFERVFPVIWQHPLPDGSVGMVRGRRLTAVTGVTPSVMARRLKEALPRFLEPYARDLDGLTVELDEGSEALLKGQIHRVRVEGRSARVAEFARKGAAQLRIREIRLVLEDLIVNPYRLVSEGEIELLEMRRMRIEHLVVDEADLRAFLHGLRKLRGLTVALEDGSARVAFAWPGPDLAGRLRLWGGGADAPLVVRPERMTLGGVPLPRLLTHWVFRHYDPGPRVASLPVAVEIGRLRVEPGRIVISSRS